MRLGETASRRNPLSVKVIRREKSISVPSNRASSAFAAMLVSAEIPDRRIPIAGKRATAVPAYGNSRFDREFISGFEPLH